MASYATIPISNESCAMQLQLEEIEAHRKRQSGKWNEDRPPDFTVAFDDFHVELSKAISSLQDLKLARSTSNAVDADAATIEDLISEEAQSARDRRLALRLSENHRPDPPDDNTLSDISRFSTESKDSQHVPRVTRYSPFESDSCGSILAGPSTNSTIRQEAVLEQIPQLKVECSVCGDKFYPYATVRLICSDIYCKECLKSFFLRIAKDESLFPPKCHSQPINISTIMADLSVDELRVYRLAEEEFTSTNRIYCPRPECAKFIPMSGKTADHASCEECGAETCVHCKAPAHDGFCPADEARQGLINLGCEQGWQPCFGCGEMVVRDEGCNHMTCGAEFCYICGVKWKQCLRGDWENDLLDRRAEEVVNREADEPLALAVRQRRVRAMAEELLRNHECDHSNRFTMIQGTSRKGMVCEICGTRHWKFLLSCKRCHMLACNDCRRYRI